MDKITLGSKLRYFSMFVPFRLYLVLFIVISLLATAWLGYQFPSKFSSFSVIMVLIILVIWKFIYVVLFLFFFSVLIPYLKFLIEKDLGRVSVSINTSLDAQGKLLAKLTNYDLKVGSQRKRMCDWLPF